MSREERTTLSLTCLLGPDHACKAATARTPAADARQPAAAAPAQAHLPACAAHERGPGAIVSAIMTDIGEVRCGA